MNNLVIGSEGFLGKPLVKFLKNLGQNVTEIDCKSGLNQDARYIKLPLNNIDRVYFLAWDVGGSKFLYKEDTQIQQMEYNNALMNNVFPQIIDLPFVFVSSQLSEDTDTVYGVQKRLGEVWTKLSEKGISVRLWNLYGYNERFEERSHVVSDFVYQAVKNNIIKMLTDGEEFRQYIHIDDVCRGLVESFNAENKKITYDISSGEWVKLIDLAKLISKITGCKIQKGKTKGQTLNIKNHQFLKNWNQEIYLEEGLERMIKQLKDELN